MVPLQLNSGVRRRRASVEGLISVRSIGFPWLPIAVAAIVGGCVHNPRHASASPSQGSIPVFPVRYPDLMRSANVEGVVILDLALDSIGRYDAHRSRVVSETHALFSLAVRAGIDSAARMRATSGAGRFVAIRRDTFAFILRRDSTQACPKPTEHRTPVCATATPPPRRSLP